jgi:hypothetical protein
MAEPQEKPVTGRSIRDILFGKKKVMDRVNESPSHPFRKLFDTLNQKKPAEKERQ